MRGRALQEWKLLGEEDRQSYSQAVSALRTRLDPGSKTLAAQDFRHTTQSETESVANFVGRLERTFQVAYGQDGIVSEAKDALFYGQLHEGLRYEIVKAPRVSGVDSYTSLCIAAKNEEHRLQELKKRQQYSRGESKPSLQTPPPSTQPPLVQEILETRRGLLPLPLELVVWVINGSGVLCVTRLGTSLATVPLRGQRARVILLIVIKSLDLASKLE